MPNEKWTRVSILAHVLVLCKCRAASLVCQGGWVAAVVNPGDLETVYMWAAMLDASLIAVFLEQHNGVPGVQGVTAM